MGAPTCLFGARQLTCFGVLWETMRRCLPFEARF